MKEGAMLEGLAKRLEESICTSIRNSDVVNHYSKGQYLVLLINTTREDLCGNSEENQLQIPHRPAEDRREILCEQCSI